MDLDRLIAGLPVTRRAGRAAVRICDLTEDSRTVMPGSLFVARRGERSDGRAYIEQALAAGAVAILTESHGAPVHDPAFADDGRGSSKAVLVTTEDIGLATALVAERFYGNPSRTLMCIGVTGTNGKTTITFLIHQLLNGAPPSEGGMRSGLIGTVCVDDGTEVAPAAYTTPPALEVSRTLARMLESGCHAVVMETSSHALHQRRVGAVAFSIAGFTNLTHDHLDYHHTMEEYAAAKAILFESLPSEADGGVAVINADDPWAERMVQDCSAKVVRCSMKARHSPTEPEADWRARVISADARQTTVDISGPWDAGRAAGAGKSWRVKLPLIGGHNVMNALQAAAIAYSAGLSSEAVREGLEKVHAPPGRLEPITPVGGPVTVYVDYAHTDDALLRVLDVLHQAKDKRAKLICVFGCGGDRDTTKRPKLGRAAAEIADRVFITSDNPRTEEPRTIIEQVMAGVPAGKRHAVMIEEDRAAAIHAAIASAEKGDVVIIAGKGHEDYQIVPDGAGGTIRNHFDDREVGRAALHACGLPVQLKPTVLAKGVTLKKRTGRSGTAGDEA